ncbi:MAG: ABC transporter ATP-binding protein [Proteobacteria bacterium]|nr:ABC transporter ATP-binding protein [Pseudomonadota bacterium]
MIEVRNLTRYYGDVPAVQDVSFSIKEGQIIGMLGLNGAGKSTILKTLAGLLVPSCGTVHIDGVDVVDAPDSLRATIGYLPESPPLYGDMTVVDYLRHVGRLKGMSGAAINQALPNAIQVTQLLGWEKQVIATLSHGYQKRVGIAQTIIHNPRLVILDEPISGLDPRQIVDMRKVIKELGQGRVVLISSHNLSEISQTCDRILILQDGRLIAQGSESELAHRASDSRIAVTVRGEQLAFVEWLEKHPLVERADPSLPEPPFASAVVNLKGDVREEFIPELISAGYPIRLIEDPDDELEEIFLNLMRVGGGT